MIKKKVITDFGVEAEIWKVGYISLDRINKYGSVTMCLYVNEEAKQYIDSVTEPILSPEVFDKYFENNKDIISNAELFIAENSDFFANTEEDIKENEGLDENMM